MSKSKTEEMKEKRNLEKLDLLMELGTLPQASDRQRQTTDQSDTSEMIHVAVDLALESNVLNICQ